MRGTATADGGETDQYGGMFLGARRLGPAVRPVFFAPEGNWRRAAGPRGPSDLTTTGNGQRPTAPLAAGPASGTRFPSPSRYGRSGEGYDERRTAVARDAWRGTANGWRLAGLEPPGTVALLSRSLTRQIVALGASIWRPLPGGPSGLGEANGLGAAARPAHSSSS